MMMRLGQRREREQEQDQRQGEEAGEEEGETEEINVAASAVELEEEWNALMEFFEALNGRHWLRRDYWGDVDAPVQTWFGVHVHEGSGRIRALVLPANNLRGRVPSAIGVLTELTTLVLRDSLVTGVPVELRSCQQLHILDVQRSCVAEFPLELAEMVRTRVLLVAADCERTKEFWFRETAGTGPGQRNGFLFWGLGMYHLKVAQDYAAALHCFEHAAELGYVRGHVSAGFVWDQGLGVPQDFARAHAKYQLAAAAGHPGAIVNIAQMIHTGELGGVDVSDADDDTQAAAKAQALYNQGCQFDQPLAYYNLGVMAAQDQDFERARDLYTHAAALGHEDAINNLAVLADNGRGVPRDRNRAKDLYRRAGSLGCVRALRNLGLTLGRTGHDCFVAAVDQDDNSSCYLLGENYLHALGCTRDDEKARTLLHLCDLQAAKTLLAQNFPAASPGTDVGRR